MENDFVVSDTNIFIDLIEAGLLNEFFSLPWRIHTTDFVLDELKDPRQRDMVGKFADMGGLTVKQYSGDELVRLVEFHDNLTSKSNLTIPDCSVWQLAEHLSCPLLTGDSKLRSMAEKHKIKVHGVLYVISKIVEHGLIDTDTATRRLQHLTEINPRLPIDQIEKLFLPKDV